jgi:hypothetical protein
MEVAAGLVLYVSPLAILPFIVRDNILLRRVAVITGLSGSLIGEVTLLLASHRYGFSSILNTNFWTFLVIFYPVAIFPLGFWVGLLSVWGCQLAKVIAVRYKVTALRLHLLGVILGAVTGGLFIVIYIGLAVVSGVSQYPQDGIASYLFSALITGAAMGPVCVKFALR